jgi:hypothetical protein
VSTELWDRNEPVNNLSAAVKSRASSAKEPWEHPGPEEPHGQLAPSLGFGYLGKRRALSGRGLRTLAPPTTS